MPNTLLTTGQAARLCSVKPDTVLKWIKKGRLRAVRTAGGHFRVEQADVASLLGPSHARDVRWEGHSALCSRPMRCWEYMNHGPGQECRNCVVRQVRAARCWQLVNVLHGTGWGRRFCAGVCAECPYYRRIHGLPTNILVITHDEALIQELARHQGHPLDFRFARRGYDASAIVSGFRPAFVILDQAVLESSGATLIEEMAADARTAGARILVALRKGALGFRFPAGAVYASIEEPFRAEEILAVVERIPVEGVEEDESA